MIEWRTFIQSIYGQGRARKMDCQPAQPERDSIVLCARFQKRLLLEGSSFLKDDIISGQMLFCPHSSGVSNIYHVLGRFIQMKLNKDVNFWKNSLLWRIIYTVHCIPLWKGKIVFKLKGKKYDEDVNNCIFNVNNIMLNVAYHYCSSKIVPVCSGTCNSHHFHPMEYCLLMFTHLLWWFLFY